MRFQLKSFANGLLCHIKLKVWGPFLYRFIDLLELLMQWLNALRVICKKQVALRLIFALSTHHCHLLHTHE